MRGRCRQEKVYTGLPRASRAEISIEVSSLIVLSCLASSALLIESQVKDNKTAFNLKVDQAL